MWNYEKRLQYPVKIARANAKLAKAIITQYGGPDGELGASLRYLSQRYSMPYAEVKGILTDIGREDSKWFEGEKMCFGSYHFIKTGRGENRKCIMLDKPSENIKENILVNLVI